MLVFLPGVREIERTAKLMRASISDPNVDVRPLYGAMSPADQDAAISPAPPGRRKSRARHLDRGNQFDHRRRAHRHR
jgi:ATP-dependent helicase HrpB